MARKCKAEGCNNFRYSHGYCKFHGYLRTDNDILRTQQKQAEKKAEKIAEQRKRRPRLTILSKTKQQQIIKQTKKDREFYQEIWETKPHNCQVCHKYLGDEPLTVYFHHILPKSKYPEFRYEPNNIMIICFNHHQEAHANNEPDWYIEKKVETINLFKKNKL